MTFAGWYTSDGIQIYPDTTVNFSGNQTLYAHWAQNQYTLYINPNGGIYANTGDITTRYSKLKYDDWNWWDIGAAIRIGYTLNNYYTDNGVRVYNKNGHSLNTEYFWNQVFKGTSDLSVHAEWIPNQYRVYLDRNDDFGIVEDILVTYDNTYYNLLVPERTGYNFNGWYTSPDGGEQITTLTPVTITEDQTLYAHWSKNKFLITFNATGGTPDTANKLVTYDKAYGVFPEATRTGFSFVGWFYDVECTQQVTSDMIVKSTANQEVYAKWELQKYINATGGNSDTATKQVIYGKKHGILPDATKSDSLEFLGWFTADGKQIHENDIVNITNDVTLYAKWLNQGDINTDGNIDSNDIILLQNYLLKRETLTEKQADLANLVQDNALNCYDLIMLKKIIRKQ